MKHIKRHLPTAVRKFKGIDTSEQDVMWKTFALSAERYSEIEDSGKIARMDLHNLAWEQAIFSWNPLPDAARRTWNIHQATEKGACCAALALLFAGKRCTAVEVSYINSGVDYNMKTGRGRLFQSTAKLEIKGRGKASLADLHRVIHDVATGRTNASALTHKEPLVVVAVSFESRQVVVRDFGQPSDTPKSQRQDEAE